MLTVIKLMPEAPPGHATKANDRRVARYPTQSARVIVLQAAGIFSLSIVLCADDSAVYISC